MSESTHAAPYRNCMAPQQTHIISKQQERGSIFLRRNRSVIMENGERREETIVGRSGRPQHPAVHDADDSSGWRKSSHRHETHKEEPINRECCAVTQGVSWNDIYYIAAFGIFGAVLRVYIGRIFGGDCETETNEIGDFWEASDICITANGLTDRRGGALFIDLPGNFVGSFLMGLLSASTAQPIPWFPKDHHLQRHTSWHKGLTTGFCGCLTTCKFL